MTRNSVRILQDLYSQIHIVLWLLLKLSAQNDWAGLNLNLWSIYDHLIRPYELKLFSFLSIIWLRSLPLEQILSRWGRIKNVQAIRIRPTLNHGFLSSGSSKFGPICRRSEFFWDKKSTYITRKNGWQLSHSILRGPKTICFTLYTLYNKR